MATRRQAREWALQMLFQLDHNPGENLDLAFAEFWKQQATAHSEDNDGRANRPDAAANADAGIAPPKIQAFAERVVRGVIQNREVIDQRLKEYVKNWPLHRMGGVERNVMRLALYELYFDETPPAVCINEAVDLAKYFSNAEAGRFVNGILDRAAREARPPAKK